ALQGAPLSPRPARRRFYIPQRGDERRFVPFYIRNRCPFWTPTPGTPAASGTRLVTDGRRGRGRRFRARAAARSSAARLRSPRHARGAGPVRRRVIPRGAGPAAPAARRLALVRGRGGRRHTRPAPRSGSGE